MDIKAIAKQLTDMKIPKPKKTTSSSVEPSYSPYPWGLQITLEKESLKKLGIKISDFKLGEKVIIAGEAIILALRQTIEEVDNNKERIELQIIKMKVV